MKTFIELEETPKNYFDLINKVGSKGPYQKKLFAIFILNWYVSSMLLMGTSFLYLNPPLACTHPSLNSPQCHEFVCSQPRGEWAQYQGNISVTSLATEFGPYQCSDQTTLNFLRSMLYLGVFCGYMTFLFFADNFGRKFSLVLSWSVTTVGLLILSISWSMTVASLGLFLAGAGCQSSIRITMSMLSEAVDFKLRQKYSVALQSTFGISGVLIGVLFAYIQQWRVIIVFFCYVPCLATLILMVTQIEETPKFLLQKGAEETLRALNRIASINNVDQRIEYEDIQPYLHKVDQTQKYVNIADLIIYPSLRTKTICVCLIFFGMTYAYIGPIIIVDKLGYNPFHSQIIISCSEILVYPITFCIIDLLPRRKSGLLLVSLATIFHGVLMFVQKPEVCDHCMEGNLEIIMIFCARFCVSMYFAIFFLYCTELYPLPARALGFGVGSSAGALASASGQIVMPYLQQMGWNPMTLLTLMCLLCVVIINFLPQTRNRPLQESLEYYPSSESTYSDPELLKQNLQWSFNEVILKQTKIIAKTAHHSLEKVFNFLLADFRGFKPIDPQQD